MGEAGPIAGEVYEGRSVHCTEVLLDRSQKGTSVRHFRRIIICAFAFLLLAPAQPAQAADRSDSDLVAGWLARTLASNNDLAITPAGDVDYASTAYALIGLRAAGVAGDQIAASAKAMAASGDSFVGAPDQADDKATAVSLMILAMSAGGLDPSHYAGVDGDRDLYADLESVVHEDGGVSSSPTAYGQSFAILALLSSPGGVPDDALQWLLAQPCADTASPGYGGYGFSGPGSCDDADPDSTALAVIAAVAAGVPADVLEPSRAFLVSTQDPSGGFDSAFSGVNANTTGLAVAALNAVSPGSDEAAKGAQFLASLMYGCDLASDPAASGLVGAMALTADSRASTQIDPLADADRALFFQASAQGIYGFIDKVINPSQMAPASPDAPGTESCPATAGSADSASPSSPAPADSAVDTGPNNWLWALGGFLVVVLVFIGWRFLLSARKP